MLKKILNLEGTQKLTKKEQKVIKGGIPYCEFGIAMRVFVDGRWIWTCNTEI
jgi:hypothetical protein